MKLSRLLEANIPIRGIERAAFSLVRSCLYDHIKAEWDHYMEAYPGAQETETWSDDRFQVYDDFNEKIGISPERRKLFAIVLMNQPGSRLAKLVRETLGVNCQVHVVVREHTDDPGKKYGGYFNYNHGVNQYTIRCFVNEHDVLSAAQQVLHDIVFGETYERSIDELVNIIVPIFIHEYTHLEQELRNPERPILNRKSNDLGITTVGGGRRGDRRDATGGSIKWARYTGSLNEIEAFAAQTAAELLARFRPAYFDADSKEIDHSYLDGVLRDIADGYEAAGTAYKSMNHMRQYWEDFKAVGVRESERDRVWRRYLKLVYQKVWQYRAENVGQTPAYRRYTILQAPQHWRTMAKKGMSQCLYAIANDIALQYSWEVRDGKATADEVASNELSRKAMDFIENYFYGANEDWDTGMKVTTAVKQIIRNVVARAAA